MISGTITDSKMNNLVEKNEKHLSDNVEVDGFKNILNAQKTLIHQQKELIDWLTGQIANSNALPNKPKGVKDYLKERPTQFWIAGLLLAFMSISSLILFFCLYNFNSPSPVPFTFGHDDNLGDGIQVIHREKWSARPPLSVTKFSKPPKIVIIRHTGGSNCQDFQTCATKVLALQGWQVASQGMPDIAYNYLIGGDGNVYEGRGPDVQSAWGDDVINIVYIGNYLTPYDQLTDKMEEAGKAIISKLEKDGYITPDYIILPHNQTYNTQSPGENIYKKIVKWPHYDPGLYF